jgi:hypothetical protein
VEQDNFHIGYLSSIVKENKNQKKSVGSNTASCHRVGVLQLEKVGDKTLTVGEIGAGMDSESGQTWDSPEDDLANEGSIVYNHRLRSR